MTNYKLYAEWHYTRNIYHYTYILCLGNINAMGGGGNRPDGQLWAAGDRVCRKRAGGAKERAGSLSNHSETYSSLISLSV